VPYCFIAARSLAWWQKHPRNKKIFGSEDQEAAGGLASAIVSATTVSQQSFGFLSQSDFFQQTPVSTRDAEPKKSTAILDMICQNQP